MFKSSGAASSGSGSPKKGLMNNFQPYILGMLSHPVGHVLLVTRWLILSSAYSDGGTPDSNAYCQACFDLQGNGDLLDIL